MPLFDPDCALDELYADYSAKADALRFDLCRQRAAQLAGQARERDAVLQGLLAEAEAGMRQVLQARTRLDDGSYGSCTRCGEVIDAQRLMSWPAVDCCMECAQRVLI